MDNLIFIQGNGSWSDGVYLFNKTTQAIDVLEWIIFPKFITYDELTQTYFIGSNNGLFSSLDGQLWVQNPFFENMMCYDMDISGTNYVITAYDGEDKIYCSGNSGNEWTASETVNLPLRDLEFANDGSLYGIFPGFSNSSGLWISENLGQNWQVNSWMDDLSCVGVGYNETIFIGGESNQGVVLQDTIQIAMNEGLPCLAINKLIPNLIIDTENIMALTDSGIYMLVDYITETLPDEVNSITSVQLSNYPNPFNPATVINFQLSDFRNTGLTKVEIYNIKGQKIKQLVSNSTKQPSDGKHSVIWNGTDSHGKFVSSGVYYYTLKVNDIVIADSKMILHK